MLNKAFLTVQSLMMFDGGQCGAVIFARCFGRVFQERTLQRRRKGKGKVAACSPALRTGSAKLQSSQTPGTAAGLRCCST